MDCALTTVRVPEKVTYLKDSVFQGCSKLTTIYLPKTCELFWPDNQYPFHGTVDQKIIRY